ncbi:hypothetical protein [Kineococcus arenarius]|uniref:hypothetical protein n=1 Tax=Kineococcus sp. SYSU DK007 TaxID=3383128 RepID=UPI003D7DDCC6
MPGSAGAAAGFERSTGSTAGALLELVVRRPSVAPAVAVYAGVTVLSRLLARRRSAVAWQRDASTR